MASFTYLDEEKPSAGFTYLDDAPPKQKQNTGIVGDIGTALKRGVLQMPGMATGLADIAAAPVSIATGVNRPVSRAADWIGEQTGFQPGKWAEAAGAEYSPEMQQAQQNVEQAKGFFPTLGAVAQNPRMILPVVGESLPSTIAGGLVARGAMGAVAGAEKLAALHTAAGSADAAVANAARRGLLKSGAIAAGIGEGAVTAGQQMAQTGYDVDPALAAGAAIGAGVGTGIIGGLSGRLASSALGRKLGLSDIETSMAAGTLGENAGKAGAAGFARRIGAGAIQEGLLEEAPQSYQEQVWQNLAAGKPLTEGAAEAAALGTVAGGVMGAGFNIANGPLSKAVAAAPGAAVPPAVPVPDAGIQPQDTLNAERISPEQGAAQTPAGIASAAQFPQFTAPSQPVTGGAPLEQAPAAMPVPQATQNAPAAPGSPSPVSAADPLPSAKQAEAAGAPTQQPQGPLPSANQTEVAIPPAQGPEAAALPATTKPAKGIAAALQYPQQVTEGGAPLAQRPADMPLGRFSASPKTADIQTKKSEPTPAIPVAESIAPAPEAGDGKVATAQGGAASEIKSRIGIAGALVTPRQPTTGGAPLEQTPVAMPLGELGKLAAVTPSKTPPADPKSSELVGASVVFTSPSGRAKRGSVIRVTNGKAVVVSPVGQNYVDLADLKRSKAESTPLKGFPASDNSPGNVKSLDYARQELEQGSPHWYVANALADDVLGDNSKLTSAAFSYVRDADNKKLWKLIDSVAKQLGEGASNNGDVRRATADFVASQTPPDAPQQPLSGVGEQQTVDRLQSAYNEAKAKLEAIGPEPRKPSNERQAFGTKGKAGAPADVVAKYEASVKAYVSWRAKYNRLKKAEVEASNALFAAKKAAPPDAQAEKSQYDSEGYDSKGYDREGFNRKGFDKYGYDEYGFDKDGVDEGGIGRDDDFYMSDAQIAKANSAIGFRRDAGAGGWPVENDYLEKIDTANAYAVADKQGFVYRGLNMPDAQAYIARGADLVLVSGNNFDEQTAGISFTPFLDIAKDYATRTQTAAVRHPDGAIVKIDMAALRRIQLEEEGDGELAFYDRKELTIPSGKWEVTYNPDAEGPFTLAVKIKPKPRQQPNPAPAPAPAPVEPKPAAKEAIGDIGEKIGGARKDMAPSGVSGGSRKNDDSRPAWARRFDISQIVTPGGMINQVPESGRWVIRDEKNLDWRGAPKQVGSTFATKEEAEAFIPIAAVSLKHRVVSIARKEQPDIDVDAMLKADMDAKAEDDAKPGKIEYRLMESAKARLANGRITQSDFDRLKDKYGEAAAQYTQPPERSKSLARNETYEIWRDISDRKRVKIVDKQFDSRDDAMRYMLENAVQIIETNTTFGEADIPLPPNKQRSGPARRTGNVSGEDFKNTFGLRAVEFGNWNNQDDRQSLMNDAWDGLMDLADVLGIPAKALGLNGDLALAFGARGQGLNSARAHYEGQRVVINLTKEKGAGSLAHEWFHAMDHYFGRQDGKAAAEWQPQADGTRILKGEQGGEKFISSGFGYKSKVRPELREAYDALMKTIFKKAETYVEDTAKADKFTGTTREELARQLDDLRKELSEQKDPKYWKRNNKPASAELLAEFDTIAKAMIDGDVMAITTDWRMIKSSANKSRAMPASRWTNDSLERLSAIYKEVRGRSGFDGTNKQGVMDRLGGYMTRYSQRLKMLADAQAGAEKQRMVPTSFAMNAKELDQGRGGDYWTTPHEMAARAFQGYVEDKISERGGTSRFLNYAPENAGILTPWGAKLPFPAGQERKAINAALDKFVGALQTRDDDDGNVILFSQESPSFYSQLSSAIASARVTSQPAAQWKAWINGNAGNLGIKKDEIEWSGILDYLDVRGKDKVTKAEIADYLNGNGVRVEDVVKADPYVDYLGDNLAPSRADQPKFSDYWQDSYKGGIPGTYREILVTLPARGDEGFKSNHWDEPNVLVHIRTDEVIGADGKRYLRVGEIQSDWGQKGKKDGFKGRSAAEIEADLIKIPDGDPAARPLLDELKAARDGVPQAPFVTDTRAWAALGIKRAIIHAINSGVDGVVFGTGEQNANLYDLSKQVSEINYRKEGDGSFLLGLKDRQGDVLPNQLVRAEKLEETVGKEVAQRMLDGEGTDIGNGLRKLSGLDLKVGGEGMRAFYDQIIPSVANDVLKKVGGGKVAAIRIDGTDYGKTGSTEEKAKYAALVAQPGFTITPQMRAKIQSQGVPLFSFAGQQSATAMAAVGASPADAAVFDMASEGKSAQEILAFLSKASRRPFNRVLAAALSRIGVSSTVSIDQAAGWRNNRGRNGAKFAASYSPKTDTVALYTPREAERHVLHEFVHAASLKAIARGGPAARQMQSIFDYVQRTGTMSDQYGMGNFSRFPNETDAQFKKRMLDEFTAELFTNPQFQLRLKQLPAPSGSKLKSAWDWIVRVIANMLGLRTKAQETALDRALSVGAALLQENAAPTAAQGGERFSQEQPFSGREVAATPLKPGTKTLMVDGVERPALNSNGNPIHWSEEGVRNFWRWFGESKVVDEQGRPLVVYHGTAAAGFTKFNSVRKSKIDGAYFFTSNKRMARSYSGISDEVTFQEDEDGAYSDQDRGVYSTYLKIDNPLEFNFGGANWDGTLKEPTYNLLDEDGDIVDTVYTLEDAESQIDNGSAVEYQEENDIGTTTDAEVRSAMRYGNDGAILFDVEDNGPEFDSYESGDVYVAFSPEQIKSATGNTGAFSEDPDIRYSLATNWPTSAIPQAKAIRDTVATALRSDANTSWITPFNTQYHKAEKWAADGKPIFKRVFNLVQQFLGDVSKYAVMAQNAAPTLLHEWRTVSDVKAALSGGDLVGRKHRADIAAVAMPLYDGTLYGGGNPMNGIKWSDERLRTKYKLTDRQIKLYHEALAAVNVSMDEMAKSVIAQHAKREKVGFDSGMDIDDMSAGVISNLEDKKQEIMESVGEIAQESVNAQIADLKEMDRPDEAEKLKREFDKAKKDAKADLERLDKTIGDINGIVAKNKALQAAGYFPLMRFGRHTVTAKDAEGKVQFFGMYDGIPLVPGSGQAEANRVAAQLKEEFPDWDVTTGIVNAEKHKLYQGVNLDALQLFAEHMEKDDVEPFQEFVRMTTNNRSAQRRMLHRKGTPGFDKDVRRTMAQFITSNARATSSNYHTQDMLRAAAEAEKDGGDIGAEAIKLVKYVQDPIEEAQALRGFLFFNFLGGSIASAMVNLTQTPAMTLPYLSKFEQAPALMRRTMAAARMAAGKPEAIADQNLRYALMRAELDGVTAPQEIHQLMATAANNIFAGSRAANILLRGWGAPFSMAESFNRRIAFITAFKIGEGMGNSIKSKTGFDNAFDFAEDVVKQTQGIYNKGNRMNIGRGAVGATLVTFKQYSVMYLELLKRLPPKQRAIMVGVLLLSAGAGGLPGVDDLEDLWDTVGQWLGYATNSKRSIRNSLTEFAGAPIADVVLNGVLSRMGIDLHSRLGMQNLIPGTGILKQSSTDKGRDIEEFFGPAASVVKSVGDALENMATGRPDKAAMAVSPVAVRNAVLGGKMASTGFAQDARGRNTVPVNEVEAFAKGIGFNPKAVAEFGSVKRDLAQDQRLVGVKREEFAAAMADAILNNDPEARLQAIKDLQEWNQNNPFHRVTITPESIAKRVRDARAEGATRMLRSLPRGMRTQAAEELRQ